MQVRSLVALMAVVILVVSPMLPAASAQVEEEDQAKYQTKQITFYAHAMLFGSGNPNPGNTMYPWGEDDTSIGSGGGDCAPAALGPAGGQSVGLLVAQVSTQPCDQSASNLMYVYSTAGPVQSEKINEGISTQNPDYTAFHNERGQTKDILFDTSKDITARFYMSGDGHSWAGTVASPTPGVPAPTPRWNWDPGYEPGWQIEATLMAMSLGEYQGQASEAPTIHPKVVAKEYVEVAKGITQPMDMVSLDESLGGTYKTVYEFNINLGKPKVDRIKKTDDWVMRFRWWSNTGGNTYIANGINPNINNGEFYPAGFTIPVKDAFDVELVYPRFVYDKLVVLGLMNTPWGSYDMDGDSVDISFTNLKDNMPADVQTLSKTADFSVAHGGHFKPINVTWVWDYQADKARAGDYKVTVSACNYQHSACSSTSAKFTILEGGLPGSTEVGRSGQASFTEAQIDQSTGAAGGDKSSESDSNAGPGELVQPGLWLSMMGLAFVGRRRAL
ncbi:MAG: hypothetical protein HY556_06340 [Euryarchaeota archaeon]|nr:hypothetical protein [Euryarchaeota archaeon]